MYHVMKFWLICCFHLVPDLVGLEFARVVARQFHRALRKPLLQFD